jgi:predicted ester cyclase
MSPEENKALVRRFYEEFLNGHDVNQAEELFAPNYVLYFPDGPMDHERQKQTLTVFRTAFPDLHFTIEDMLAEGDKVATRFRWQGIFQGIPPSGKQVTVSGIALNRIAEGKLVEDRTELDLLGLMQQLGARLVSTLSSFTWKARNLVVNDCRVLCVFGT